LAPVTLNIKVAHNKSYDELMMIVFIPVLVWGS